MSTSKSNGLGWSALPPAARGYVAGVIVLGTAGLVLFFPTTLPQPSLFVFLLLAGYLTSLWKVNLPIPLLSGSTLSVSYAPYLASLLLLGPRPALLIAAAGALAQCTIHVRQRYPLYRTAFSVCAEVITMIVSAHVYAWLGGSQPPLDIAVLPKALIGASAAHFILNTGQVATAIGLSAGRSPFRIWCDEFL
jgi:hypothetical protein